MKKIITVLAVIAMFGFQGCEGPEGPPGQDGYNGVGAVYENNSNNYYNFTSGNNFKVRFNFPEPIFDSDVVLVYRLGGVDSGKAIWEFLPQTYYLDNGTRDISYNFNFTFNYVDIYLSGNDLTDPLLDEFRFDQIFRIVVVPADFVNSVDKNNYLEVMKTLNLEESKIQEIKF